MSSILPRSTRLYTPVDAKVWDMVFLDTKTKANKKKKAAVAAEPTVLITAKNIDIRNWSFGDRKMLSKGDRVDIFIGDTLATTISKPLLRATSVTAGDVLKDGVIKLPADIDKDSVFRIVKYLEAIVQITTKPLPLTRSLTMPASLGVCAAARVLGMDKYTAHLYQKCEALLRIDPPAYEDIDAIIAFREAHKRLFDIVVDGLAVHVWEGTVPDPEDFAVYLALNPILDTAIKARNKKNEFHVRKMQKIEEHRVQQEVARARREAWVKEKTEREAKKRADDKAFYAAKTTKDAALEKSVQKKMRASEPKERKFTQEESAHYWRRYGKKPPKGC